MKRLRSSRFSKPQLAIFAIAFALIGYLIFRSFALNPNLPGDLNNDNTVNIQDLSILLSNYGTSSTTADINSDGTVNILDMSILLSNYGKTYSPSTITLGINLPARLPLSSGASHIYVSPAGSDSNSGSIAAPVYSLAKAFSLAVSGSFIEVRGNAGAYTQQSPTEHYQVVSSHCSFSSANPVTVRTYTGDPRAVFASTDTTHNNVYFGNCAGIRIQNLTFASPYSVSGIKIDSSVNIELSSNIIGPSGDATSQGSMGILVSSSASGIGTSTITTNLQILNNTVFNWYGNSSLPNNNHGMYLSEGDKILVANNIIYNNVLGAGYGIQLGGETNNSWIVNNTIDGITSNGSSSYNGGGIVVWGSLSEKTQAPTNNNIIENNLVTNEHSYAIGSSGSTPGPLSLVKNNLAYNNGAPDYQPFYGADQLFTCGGTNSTTCPGLNLPNANPMYIDRLGFNFHLQAGSPAIGKSDPPYTPPYDHDSNARNSTPNLGAF
jgi:hypothetical protein